MLARCVGGGLLIAILSPNTRSLLAVECGTWLECGAMLCCLSLREVLRRCRCGLSFTVAPCAGPCSKDRFGICWLPPGCAFQSRDADHRPCGSAD